MEQRKLTPEEQAEQKRKEDALLESWGDTTQVQTTTKKKKKRKKKKKKSQNNNVVQKNPSAPQATSGKISPTQLATAPLIKEEKDEKLYKYLIDVCGEKDDVQAIIWSVINKYLKNGSFGEKGYYSGGFATYLLTKGKYPTTDIDYKIYPRKPDEKVDEKYWENYLKKNKDNIFNDIKKSLPNNKKEYFNGILVGRPPGNLDGPIKITLLLKEKEEVRYNPPIMKYGQLVAIENIDKKAYCDIAFYSKKDLINDLKLPFIDKIYPKHDEELLTEIDMHVIDKDFMIAEKKIFLEKLNNESMLHKITNWKNQLNLLKGLKGGRRRTRRRKIKRTRRKRRRKKKRTKKKRRRRKKRKTRRR